LTVGICVRYDGVIRRLVRLSTSADGSVYTTLGYYTFRSVKAYEPGKITIPAGQQSQSASLLDLPSTTFEQPQQTHQGFKASGRAITKIGLKHLRGTPFPPITSLTKPELMETIYPSRRLEAFRDVERLRKLDVVIPDHAMTPQNLKVADLTHRFGDAPFSMELWALPPGTSALSPSDLGTVGFGVVVNMKHCAIAAILRQTEVDLKRGWLEHSTVLRSWGESPTDEAANA
jgi:hypothetical protein